MTGLGADRYRAAEYCGEEYAAWRTATGKCGLTDDQDEGMTEEWVEPLSEEKR